MGKFGKRNTVSKSITDYNIAILGLAGIGKTTLMTNVCQKLVGDDGYIIFNIGKEDGISCIDGAIYENIENWKKFDDVTADIIKNKKTDYPDLKIIVLDTIDQLFDIAETQVIRMYNAEKIGEKNFKSITSINAAYGGYGAGLEKTVQIVLDKIWDLKRAGIAVWIIGHTKSKDIVDPLTDQSYTTISANLSQKYFNAIKTKMHIVGMAVIDRNIITEATGRKDINHNEITKNKVVSEARKIIFRDDNYGVDSKSRFADIADEIPLDADAFIKAVQEAIYKAQTEPTVESIEKKSEPKPEPAAEPVVKAAPAPESELPYPEEEMFADDFEGLTDDELRDKARAVIKGLKDVRRDDVKTFVASYGKFANVDRAGLLKILAMA